MEVVSQAHVIEAHTDNLENLVEHCGRVCYKSQSKGRPKEFVERLRDLGHHSVLEHGAITVRIITDRAVTHELVRHRLASYSQESQRYCAYRDHVRFIQQWWMTAASLGTWDESTVVGLDALSVLEGLVLENWYDSEQTYQYLLREGMSAQAARAVLPNATESTIVVTANPREWRHIFNLRCSKRSYPQMRALMQPMLQQFAAYWPALFGDLEEKYGKYS